MLFPSFGGQVRLRRGSPHVLVALILFAASSMGCSPGSTVPDDDFGGDQDGDGVLDTLGRALDLDSDGALDWYDVDGDGTLDGVGIDIDGDRAFDGVGIDANADGIIDSVDTTGNKMPDIVEDKGDGDSDIVVPGGDGDGDGDQTDGDYCNDFATTFEPKTPTVYVLVDHSSSMYRKMFWEPMKTGVLQVVQQLQGDVRFGFGSFTGVTGAPVCEGLTPGAAIAENNYEAIEAAYNALQAPDANSETETPTPLAIRQTLDILAQDEAPGDKYILLVSDGEPDFCDDQLGKCAADATIAALQYAYSQGVRTLVFGIDNSDIETPLLFDYFAQAGIGEEPNWADALEVLPYSGTIESQCTGKADIWTEYQELLGNAPPADACGDNRPNEGNTDCYLPAANYSTAGGTATAFLEADPAALGERILTSVESLKSCRFEFNFEVTDPSTGEIFVGDRTTPIPKDQWEMVDINVLELTGAACTKWQDPTVFEFFAGFPCEAIVEIIR